MKNNVFSKVALLCLVSTSSLQAYAVTCTSGDMGPLCNLPEIEGTRCATASFFAFYCTNQTAGCETVPGGCFGSTPPGHWYPIADATQVPRWKCRCGCGAEETVFDGPIALTGSDLIRNSEASGIFLSSVDDYSSPNMSPREINGIMYGPEKEGAYRITTAAGRVVTLSASHPVPTVTDSGELVAMKQAQILKSGEFVQDTIGMSDEITRIERIAYAGRMVNFNVVSSDAAHHIVVANGLRIGDRAWQERLHSVESRMLYRAEILKSLAHK